MSNIKVVRNGLELPLKSFVFPGGEVGVKFDMKSVAAIAKTGPFAPAEYQTIVARLKNSQDIMELLMVKDALDLVDNTPIRLFMPYVPYARQDRVCDKGESFSVQVFADLINSVQLKFQSVTIVDPHSNVATTALNFPYKNVKVISQLDVIQAWREFSARIMKGVTFVSPDAGANKKVSDAASYFNHYNFIRADKLRDMSTGKIKETIVYADDLQGRDVCILDDLADGAKTFTELAKVLKKKNAGKILLYVTHGIFSKTIEYVLENGIDEVWTTDSFRQDIKSSERVRVFQIENLLHF